MLNELTLWFYTFVQTYGYLGCFILSVLSNLIIFVPIPYLLIVVWLSTVLDPWILAIVSGFGATLGKVIIYHIGVGGRKLLSENQKKKLEFAKQIMNRYGALAVFIFAVTPIPDDILYLPLGMMQFDLLRFFFYCLLGKIVLTAIIAVGGHYSYKWVSYLLGGGESIWASILIVVFIIASIYVTVKIDWEDLFYRYFSKPKSQQSKTS